MLGGTAREEGARPGEGGWGAGQSAGGGGTPAGLRLGLHPGFTLARPGISTCTPFLWALVGCGGVGRMTDARRDACAPCHHASVGQIRAVGPCVIVCEHQSMPDRRGRAGATCVLASFGGRSPDAAPVCSCAL